MLTKEQVLEKIGKGESFKGVEIGDVDFSGHIFDKAIDFKLALFKKDAKFGGAIFQKKINFSSSRFDEDVSFTNSHFKDEAIFDDVLFQRRTLFLSTQFENDVSFLATQFQNTVYFAMTKFQKRADFIITNFGGHALFSRTSFSNMDQTSFNGIVFQKPEQVIFQIVDLSKCSLINTDLSKIGLTGVIFPIKKSVLDKRTIIYDEIGNKSEGKNYALIEKIYRDLKKNYESRGSYGEAGDFHYGEMEMRGLSQKKFFRYVSLTSFYKYLSGYGEKYWLAVFWLGAFLVIFAGLYLITGIESATQGASGRLNYNFSLDVQYLLSSAFWKDFSNSLLHTLEVATFQRERSFASISTAGKYLGVFQTIFISLQVAFTALAIKRKFRR